MPIVNNNFVKGGHAGGSFNRGGHTSGNHFRGGGGNRTSISNDSHHGPMRNEGSFRQQRNAPYSKGLPQQNQSQNFDGPPQPFRNKFNQGGGNMSHNDLHAGSSGAGASGSQRGPGSSNNIGQDRRGFALPAVDHQQQQQVSFGAKQGRFRNGSMVPSGSNADNGIFQRHRNNPEMNRYNAKHQLLA